MRWIFLLFSFSALAAVNTTTPGALTLSPTFECISVTGAFSGDDNANNSASVQFKRSSSGVWLNAYVPYIDRRATLISEFGPNDNSANVNQARLSIVGLSPNTSYDVAITWSDADGIVGAASVTNTVSTLSYSIPTNGNDLYVDASAGSEGSGTSGSPYKTITNALALCSAGDTIHVRSGSYVPFTWTKSGTSSAYVRVISDAGANASIQGGNAIDCILVNANYIAMDGLNFEQSTNNSVRIGDGFHHVWILNTVTTNFCSDQDVTRSFGAAGVRGLSNTTNIYVLTNHITTTHVVSSSGANVYPIFFFGTNYQNWIVSDNFLTNGWDGFGDTGNKFGDGPSKNCDFSRNYFINYADDSTEIEGDCNNVRYWGNTIRTDKGNSLLGMSGVMVGPAYIFRNTFGGSDTNSQAAGMKHARANSPGQVYYFHNVIDTIDFSGSSHEAVSGPTNVVLLNNIILANGSGLRVVGAQGTVCDYNIYTNRGGSTLFRLWDNTTDYATIALFRAGTGQETHGFNTDPLLNSDFTVATNSVAVNGGVVINNFNDSNSKWPYQGSAPDIGAFESGVVIPTTMNTKVANIGRITAAP